MTSLKKEMAVYDRMRRDLEIEHLGEWVVVDDEVLVGAYASFQAAADEAVQKFGRGPCLIWKLGASP